MKRKKIAFFITSYFDGIGVNTLRLAEEFFENGYDVDLLIVKNEEKLIKNVPNEVNIIYFKQTSVYKSLFQLINYIKKSKPEAIMSGGEAPNIVLITSKLILFNKKFKTIVSIRTHLTTQYKHTKGLNQTILKYLGKIIYRFADEIVAVSKGVAEDVSKLFYINPNRIHVIYNPIVNKDTFSLAEERVSHNWLEQKKVPVILGAGRLERQKNFPLLINAFALVRKEVDVKLIIIGEGRERFNLEKLIKKIKLEEDVCLVGYESNPYAYMKNSDVFVLSSDWEGFGNVIVEAMACGMKIVSTDCPSGPSEILDAGNFGLLVEENNPGALAKAIVQTLKCDEFKLERNIERASCFSRENTMRSYEKLL